MILRRALNKKVDKVIREAFSSANLKSTGEETVRQMKGRIRQGKAVFENGKKEERFKALAESTVKARRRKSLGSFASVNRSNLNESGDMVDSISAFVVNAGSIDASVVIDVAPEEFTKAKAHHEGNSRLPKRPFMFLSNKEIKRVTVSLQSLIDKAILKVNSIG